MINRKNESITLNEEMNKKRTLNLFGKETRSKRKHIYNLYLESEEFDRTSPMFLSRHIALSFILLFAIGIISERTVM